MERGLLWSSLLIVFIWLTWQGWNEYQKVEAYRIWAQQFERAKYDIYAVLGQNGTDLTWGKPTRSGPINLETFSLKDLLSLDLIVDGKPVNLDSPPDEGTNIFGSGKAIALEFVLSSFTICIPFTEIPLAAEWGKYLMKIPTATTDSSRQ